MKLHDAISVKMEYFSQKQLLVVTWLGVISTEEFVEKIRIMIDLCSKYKVKYVIADTQLQAPLTQEATDFAARELSHLVELGAKRILFVLPESIYTQMSFDMYTEELAQQRTEQFALFFKSYADAEKWMEENIQS